MAKAGLDTVQEPCSPIHPCLGFLDPPHPIAQRVGEKGKQLAYNIAAKERTYRSIQVSGSFFTLYKCTGPFDRYVGGMKICCERVCDLVK